jgi:4-amino-4-deoxy-L-arabinose transferase-like glycosyltransferase
MSMKHLFSSERAWFAFAAGLGLYLCLALPVFSQEAYYWSYSQHPDLSYYDHPPMVAWLIWLGTKVFGHGALGIRIGTLLCSIGLTLTGLVLLRSFGADSVARRAWIVLSIGVPQYVVLHVLANPDPPLCLFWALSMLCLWRARDGLLGWWLCAGVAAGLALLSKYMAAFLAVGGVLVLLFDPKMRRQLLCKGPWLGVLAATLTFLPVILWNVNNNFESFRFQTGGRMAKAALTTRWVSDALVGQLGVFNPGLLLLLPFTVAWLFRKARSGDARALWLFAFGVPLPAFFLVASLAIQVKINWFVPAYLPLLLGMLLWWREHAAASFAKERWYVRLAVWTVMLVVALAPLAPLIRLVPQSKGSTWSGWDRIAAAAESHRLQLDAEDQVQGNVFLFGADYKDSAQLLRALTILSGDTKPASVLAQNVCGDPALQFDHWDPPKRHIGEHAIFVLARPDDRQEEVAQVKAFFASVEVKERVVVTALGWPILEADLLICRSYRGPFVESSVTGK